MCVLSEYHNYHTNKWQIGGALLREFSQGSFHREDDSILRVNPLGLNSIIKFTKIWPKVSWYFLAGFTQPRVTIILIKNITCAPWHSPRSCLRSRGGIRRWRSWCRAPYSAPAPPSPPGRWFRSGRTPRCCCCTQTPRSIARPEGCTILLQFPTHHVIS